MRNDISSPIGEAPVMVCVRLPISCGSFTHSYPLHILAGSPRSPNAAEVASPLDAWNTDWYQLTFFVFVSADHVRLILTISSLLPFVQSVPGRCRSAYSFRVINQVPAVVHGLQRTLLKATQYFLPVLS